MLSLNDMRFSLDLALTGCGSKSCLMSSLSFLIVKLTEFKVVNSLRGMMGCLELKILSVLMVLVSLLI